MSVAYVCRNFYTDYEHSGSKIGKENPWVPSCLVDEMDIVSVQSTINAAQTVQIGNRDPGKYGSKLIPITTANLNIFFAPR